MHLPGPGIGSLFEPLTGRRWDRHEVLQRVQSRSGLFARAGMSRGDRVFIMYGNRLEFFVDLLAIWTAGGCAVPIDTRLTPFEIGKLIAAARPRFAVSLPELETTRVRVVETADVRLLSTSEQDASSLEGASLPGYNLDDPALILFTSGTTGTPKGVVHTHRSLAARWTALGQVLGTDAYRRTLCPLPTHFGHGLICNCLFPWLRGADLGLVPGFNAEVASSLSGIVDTEGITFMSSVPALWRLATRVSRPPTGNSLQRIHCGSAPLSKSLWGDIRAWSGTTHVYNTYGITETGSWTAGTSLPEFEPEDGFIGPPWGATVSIRPTASVPTDAFDEQICRTGEEGYVWLHTPALMQGYLDQDELTREVVTRGWFSTGDAGVVDDRGYLFLKGRLREEINKGGLKVYPADVDAVAEAERAVLDVCAFAVEDPLYGQNVGIALVLDGPTERVMRAVRERIEDCLAEHQRPVRWYVLEEIPRTSRGKVNRSHVARTCSGLREYRFSP